MGDVQYDFENISIPSPHTGRDSISGRAPTRKEYFNPLSPYGERQPDAVPVC